MGLIMKYGIPYCSDPSMVELTKAEYDALSTEDKNSSTLYFITDVEGNEQTFQPICYTNEEQTVGCWRNGKPLYQKLIEFTPTKGAISTYAHNIENIDEIIFWTGGFDNGNHKFIINGDTQSNLINENLNEYSSVAVISTIDNTNIEYQLGTEWSGDYTCRIILQYTKTTDQPGSGQWTPQGVPAVHYSTDEHVVGTWIDGSTIYERTVEIINSFSSSYYYDVSSFSNGILNFEGYYLCTTDKTYRIPLNYYEDNTYHTYTGYNVTTNKMFLKVYGFTGQKAILTIRYTKSSS